MPMLNIIHISIEIWGIIFCVIAILCVLSGVKEEPRSSWVLIELLSCNILILMGDALAWAFRGDESLFGWYMVRISNFSVFFMSYMLMWSMIRYLEIKIENAGEEFDYKLAITARLLCLIGALSVIVSQFNNMYYYFDAHNFYHRNIWYPMIQILAIINMFVLAVEVLRHRKIFSKLESLALFTYFILPITAMVLLIFIYGISFLNLAISVSGLLMFLVHMVERSRRLAKQAVDLAKVNEELAKKELETVQSKTGLLLGQIRPHLIYNCLGIIRGLCVEDTEKAVDMIDHFSGYLRSSLSIMDREQCISFRQEMELVENYLFMEQQRFPDSIEVELDIKEEHFEVPPLSVQPIVENAVRHGIRARREKGKIRIATESTETDYRIVISDDGAGFDPAVKKQDGRSHVGMENVARRLEYMAHGHMEVESRIGQGTTVTLVIPKKKEEERMDVVGEEGEDR